MCIRDRVYRGEDEIDNGCVCWLPLYHDMGLVGCLYLGMYYPGTVTYMGPDTFLAKPAIWLRTLSRYKSAISPAPHFAYSLCATKVKDEEMEGVDLDVYKRQTRCGTAGAGQRLSLAQHNGKSCGPC